MLYILTEYFFFLNTIKKNNKFDSTYIHLFIKGVIYNVILHTKQFYLFRIQDLHPNDIKFSDGGLPLCAWTRHYWSYRTFLTTFPPVFDRISRVGRPFWTTFPLLVTLPWVLVFRAVIWYFPSNIFPVYPCWPFKQ